MLSIIIVFTVVVKGLTHLFTLGYIPSPMLTNCLPHDGVIPSIEEDFGVVLLKLGTACLEVTQYSGLRNELISVQQVRGPWLEMSATGAEIVKKGKPAAGGFATEITDIQVPEMDPEGDNNYWREYKAFWYTLGALVLSSIWWSINATPVGRKGVELVKKSWRARWWYGPRQWRFWRREAWREPARFADSARQRRNQRIRDILLRSEAIARSRDGSQDSVGVSSAVSYRLQAVEPSPPTLQWREILRGEVEVEDDDDEWEDDAASTSSEWSDGSDEDDQTLYRDLVVTEQSEEDFQPVLLAHLTNHSSPLTRKRYSEIMSPSHDRKRAGLAEVIQDRRQATAGSLATRNEFDDEVRRSCVVCTVEPRDTIFWPCRCLAVCDDCRESLASRLAAKDHMCPCCRKKVEGFSRIYIP